MRFALLPLLLGLLSADLSLQEKAAPQTDFSPTATSGPEIIPEPTAFNLTRRVDSIPSNFCGWYSGSGYDQRWIYNDPSVTCFWNSDARFVGDAIPPQTACIPESALSTWSCSGLGCSSSVATCTGTQPYCVTFTYGSDYLSFVCSEQEGIEYQMEPYWSGFSDPIAFPVYTGSNGISTGTQYPPGYPTPSSTSSDLVSSPISDSISNPPSSTAQGNSGSSTSGNNGSNQHNNSAPIGAIVGGVIGGLTLISLVVGAIVFFAIIRPRRRQALAQPQYYQTGPQGPPQYPPPGSPPMAPVPQTIAVQNSPPQQAPRYEVDTQHNKPELSGQQQRYELNQQNIGSTMQPIQPEYVSIAPQVFKPELDSQAGQYSANPGVVSGGHEHEKGGENVYEAP